jgi:hypothetical protein
MAEQKPVQKPNSSLNYRLPTDVTMQHAAKLSLVDDKPIMLDYWSASLDKKALIGAKENGEKLLVGGNVNKLMLSFLLRSINTSSLSFSSTL